MRKTLQKRRIENVDEDYSGTLTSAGGTSIIKTGSGETKYLKGLTAGTGITLTPGTDDVTIANSASYSITSAGGTTIIKDGSSEPKVLKGLTAGSGITVTGGTNDVTVASTTSAAPTSIGANDTATANSLTLSSNVLKAAVCSPAARGVNYGYENTSAFNHASGFGALNNVAGITGTGNTASGYGCGQSVSGAGANNTLYGVNAGSSISTGTKNTMVGSTVNTSSATGTDRGVFGYNESSTANGTMLFTSNFTTIKFAGATTFSVSTSLGTSGSAANVFYDTATGNFLRSTSMESQKTNIKPIELSTSNLLNMSVVEYEQNCIGDQYQEPGTAIGCDYCSWHRGEFAGIDSNLLDENHLMDGTCPYHVGQPAKKKVGFLAGDFETNGLGVICEKNEKGEIIDYDVKCLIGCLFNEIKRLRTDVDNLMLR